MFDRQHRDPSDFLEELRAHLELEVELLRSEGLSEEQAYRQARRSLGNLTAAEERFYESSRWIWIEQLKQDTRLALRRQRKSPVFAVTTIITLALGIGATTSIFTSCMPFSCNPSPLRIPTTSTGLANKITAASTVGTTREASSPSSPTICTSTFASTLRASPNSPHSRLRARFSECEKLAVQAPRKA